MEMKIFSTINNFALKAFYILDEALDHTLFSVGETAITYWGLLRFFAILILTLYVSRFFIRTLSSYAIGKKVKRSVVYRLSRLLHYLVLTIGILLALSSVGFNFSNLLLVAGALGVGLGFGLQSIFNNFVSGLIMLFESQLKIGDIIEVAPGVKGEIKEISVRSTLLTTTDGVDIIVPNSEFISNRVTNWTFRHTYRRLHVPFSVAYGTNLKKMQEVIVEVAKKMPETLIKTGFDEPQVIVTKLADSAIECELVLWILNIKGSTQSNYLIAINNVFVENNIAQPFPQRDLNITSFFGVTNIGELKELLKP